MFFFVRTQNPRPSFHLDMTPDERAAMEQHVAYWSEQAALGVAIVFGPVMDPAGVYGIGVYKVADERQMQNLLEGDPAKGLLQCQAFPMAGAVVAGPPQQADAAD